MQKIDNPPQFEVGEEVSNYTATNGMHTTYTFPDGVLYWKSDRVFAYVSDKYFRIKIPDDVTMNDFINSYDGLLLDMIAFKIL